VEWAQACIADFDTWDATGVIRKINRSAFNGSAEQNRSVLTPLITGGPSRQRRALSSGRENVRLVFFSRQHNARLAQCSAVRVGYLPQLCCRRPRVEGTTYTIAVTDRVSSDSLVTSLRSFVFADCSWDNFPRTGLFSCFLEKPVVFICKHFVCIVCSVA